MVTYDIGSGQHVSLQVVSMVLEHGLVCCEQKLNVLPPSLSAASSGHLQQAVSSGWQIHTKHSPWRERERNVLFNDALNTFYLRLYGVRHSQKGNQLPPHRLLLSINSKGSFICTIPQTG